MNQSILKTFIKYVRFNILGMIGLSCYILADTFFVSKALGANGLAALNFSISIYCVINGLGLMIGIGGATGYSIAMSQDNSKKANEIFTHAVITGLFAAFLLVLAGIFLSSPLARLLGANDTTYTLTVTYLRTILCFSPFFILNNIMLAFIRNDHNPGLSMSAMILGSLSNIVLDYVFMFPFSMGMFGAAFATGLAPIISLLLLSSHFIRRKNHFKLTRCILRLKYFGQIASLGLSAFITEISSCVVLIIFNLVILRLEGNVGVAAYGIIANLALVVLSVFNGISQGMQPLASRGYGTGDTLMLKKILRYAIMLSFAAAAFVYILTFAFSSQIIAAFNSEGNTQLVPIAENGFRLYFIGFFFAGINIVVSSFLSATAKPKRAFMISITRGFLAMIPLVFILTNLFFMNGVWLSFPIAEAIAFFLAVCLLSAQKKVIPRT